MKGSKQKACFQHPHQSGHICLTCTHKCTHLNFNHLNNTLDMLRIWAVQKGQVGIRKRLFPTPVNTRS